MDSRPAHARYLVTEQAAEYVGGVSIRTIGEWTRKGLIPHRRIGRTRRNLFLPEELDLWVNGCELETIETPNGGRVCRPVTQ